MKIRSDLATIKKIDYSHTKPYYSNATIVNYKVVVAVLF